MEGAILLSQVQAVQYNIVAYAFKSFRYIFESLTSLCFVNNEVKDRTLLKNSQDIFVVKIVSSREPYSSQLPIVHSLTLSGMICSENPGFKT